MKFCPECGANVEGMQFCGSCGTKVGAVAATSTPAASTNEEKTVLEFSTYLYGMEGKKAGFMSMPQENYTLTNERLIIEKQGMMSKKKDDIELFKINDIEIEHKMKDKMMGVGDVIVTSSDASHPRLVMKRIKNPLEVRETLRNHVKAAKKEAGVTYRAEV